MCDGKAINHNEHVALTEFHNQQSSFQNSSITKRRRSGARKTQPECNCSDANLRHFYTLHTHSHDTDCQCFNWMIWFERRRRQPIPILPLRLCLWYGRQYFWLVNGCWSFPNHIYMNVFTAVRMSIDAIGFRKLFLLRYSCSYCSLVCYGHCRPSSDREKYSDIFRSVLICFHRIESAWKSMEQEVNMHKECRILNPIWFLSHRENFTEWAINGGHVRPSVVSDSIGSLRQCIDSKRK